MSIIQMILACFGWGMMCAFLLAILWHPLLRKQIEPWYHATGALTCLNSFIVAAQVHSIAGQVANGLGCAWFVFRFWNDDSTRRRRRRLIERANGFVRDVGGRLKVVQPAPVS